MPPEDAVRQTLLRGRDALRWKLDGLSEYDLRRPLTPTGTNLLGLLKHTASVTAGYLGDVFDRPFPHAMPWLDAGAEPNADMWATEDETSVDIFELWDAAWAHAEATLDELPLDAVGHVPWWPEERNAVTLHQIAGHLIAEVHRHAGHADIVRELIDGEIGMLPEVSNLPDASSQWWSDHVARIEATARRVAT